MTIKHFAKFQAPHGLPRDVYSEMLENWQPNIQARSTSNNEINIYDVIGKTYDGEGVTLKRIDAALRSIGHNKDASININSPGGDYFMGVGIYSRLLEHKGKITVKILGMAASAASVIAMAGDEILIAKPANIMIHNAWGIAVGNSAAMLKVAEDLADFDQDMGNLYAEKTGIDKSKIHSMMDDETYLNGTKAVEMKFADGLLNRDQITHADEKQTNVLANKRRIEYALRKEGMNDDEVKKAMSSFDGSQDDATHSEIMAQDAKVKSEILAGLNQLIETFK